MSVTEPGRTGEIVLGDLCEQRLGPRQGPRRDLSPHPYPVMTPKPRLYFLSAAAHLRAGLEYFDLKRLTVQLGSRLLDILGRRYPYVDDILNGEEME